MKWQEGDWWKDEWKSKDKNDKLCHLNSCEKIIIYEA